MAGETGPVSIRDAMPEWHPHEVMDEAAARELPRLLAVFCLRGRALIRKRSSAANLHSFRLDVKRMRYVLELFEPVYGESVAPLMKELKHLQSLLGDMNDCDATRLHLRSLGKVTPEFEAYLDDRFESLFTELRAVWRAGLRQHECEARWMDILAGSKPKPDPALAAD